MTTATSKHQPMVPTSDANKVSLDAMSAAMHENFDYLAGRWEDEKEYEDITDYASHIMKFLPDGFILTKMSQRPFGFYFTIGNGAVYFYYATSKTVGWKQVK